MTDGQYLFQEQCRRLRLCSPYAFYQHKVALGPAQGPGYASYLNVNTSRGLPGDPQFSVTVESETTFVGR